MKTRHDSRGISHILIPILIILIVAVAGAGWYVYKNQKNNSSSAGTAESKAAVDECNKLYSDKDLCKFAGNYNPTSSYKATFTDTSKDGKTTNMTMETDTKGNSSTTTSENGKETGAFISLNGDTYMKDMTDNSWIKYPKSPDTPATTPTTDMKIDFKNEASKTPEQQISYKKLGKEACGNTTCFKYQVTDPSQPNTTSLIWFGTKDYQLHQWSFTDADGNKNVGTFNYVNVTIKAPTPVKDAAATPSAADIENMLNQQ